MNYPAPYPQRPGFFEKNRTIIKGFLIGFLILLMLIPSAFLGGLVNERQQRQQEVISEISSKWASQQTLLGPVLMIPYRYYANDKDGKSTAYRGNIYLLPDDLKVNAQIAPEVRHRSLYNVTLYRSNISMKGAFSASSIKNRNIDLSQVYWNESKLLVGIDDARGLEEEMDVKWNNQQVAMEAGLPENTVIDAGLSGAVSIDSQNSISFSIEAKLKGSEYLFFTPVGKTTEVNLTSAWKDPAFDGQYLPSKHTTNDSGFTANWKVLQVSKSYPQSWITGNYDLEKSSFGVRLIQPTDSYAKTQRSVKYAILFIFLTFTVFFFIEIFQKRQVHPLQYILVGFALCIFYTLLLSISEYTGFNAAYLAASSATILLIALYVWSIFKKGNIAFGFGAALTGLYGYIFILIQLQDYALLFGSIGLFVIIAVLMYCSRKIDWYNTDVSPQNTTTV